MKKTTNYLLIAIVTTSLSTKMNAGNGGNADTTACENNSTVQKTENTNEQLFMKKGHGGGGGTFAAAANLSYLTIGGVGSTTGIGAQFVWNSTEKISFLVGVDYFFPKSVASTNYLNDSTGSQTNTPVTITDQLSFFRFALNAQYYFVGDNEDTFNMYGLAGIGALLVTDNTTVGTFDATKYTSPITPGSIGIQQLYINLGIGAEYKVGPGHIFVNAQVNLPPTSVNGQAADINLPTTFMLVGGYKYLFGK